jgi:hypothetical protein
VSKCGTNYFPKEFIMRLFHRGPRPRLAVALAALTFIGAGTIAVPIVSNTAAFAAVKIPFTITTSLTTIELAPGGEETIDLRASRTKGFTSPIFLGVRSLPKGIRITTAENPLKGSSTTVKIAVDAGVAAKTYSATLTGSSKGKSSQKTIKIVVSSSTPLGTGATPTVAPTAVPTSVAPTTLAPSTIPATLAPTLPPTTLAPATTIAATTTTAAPNDYTLAADPNVNLPASGTAVATIRILRTGGFKDVLDFKVEGLPDKVSGTFGNVTSTSESVALTLRASGATQGLTAVTVIARGRTVKFNLTVVPSSAVIATPASVNLPAAGGATVGLRWGRELTAGAGVTWAVANLPNGVTANFSPNGVAANETTLSLTAPASAVVGSAVLLTITASSGVPPAVPISDIVSLPVTIVAVGSGPVASTIPGATTIPASTIPTTNTGVVAPVATSVAPGTSGVVLFTPGSGIDVTKPGIVFSQVGLPAGVSPSATISGSSLSLTLATTAATPPGVYPVTFTLTQGTLSSSGLLTLTISGVTTTTVAGSGGFQVALGSAVLSIARGASSSVGVNAVFSATPEPVTYSVSGLPAGASISFSTVNPTAGATSLTISVPATAAAGTYPVAVTGTIAGRGIQTATLSLTVS